jgi:hypothetical protein
MLQSSHVRSQVDSVSTFFHEDRIWPMQDDACPLQGWDYNEYMKFASKAANDVMGSFFFFLRDTLLSFCNRIRGIDMHIRLFNVDARVLPGYLSTEESRFDCVEVSISLVSTSKCILTAVTKHRSQIFAIVDTLDLKRFSPRSARSSNHKQHC